jgi:hypothetical protein
MSEAKQQSMMRNKISRRSALLSGAATLLASAFESAAFAAEQKQPHRI